MPNKLVFLEVYTAKQIIEKNKPIRRTLQTHANNDVEKERGKRQVK